MHTKLSLSQVCSTGLPADAGKATAELEGAGFSGRYMELTGNMCVSDWV